MKTSLKCLYHFGVFLTPLMWIMITAGCSRHDPDRFVLASDSSVQVDQLFTLQTQGDSLLAADGFSRITLVAQLHGPIEGVVPILFTTSAGALRVGTTSRPDSAVVETDLTGRATVELVSERQTGVARVVARVMDITPALVQERTISFVPVVLDDILRFIDAPDSAIANGKEVIMFRVQITDKLDGEDRRVTFTTTQGTFIPAGEFPQVRSLFPDQDNTATVQLRSSDEVTEALVVASVKGFTQEISVQFVSVPVDRIIRFGQVPDTVSADGATLSRVTVIVSPELLGEDNPTVLFETTLGTFASARTDVRQLSVVLGGDNEASAFLRSPNQVGQGLLSTEVGGFIQTQTVVFERAEPDTILVTVGQFQISANDQMLIEAELIRNENRGTVTVNTEVAFSALDSFGQALDQAKFFNTTRSDADGRATTVFTPDGSAYRGLVDIRVKPARGDTSAVGWGQVRIVD